MISFERLHPKHFEYIAPAAMQTAEYSIMQSTSMAELCADGFGISAWVSGKCIGAAGVFVHYKGRAEGWMMLGCDANKYILPCIRKIRGALEILPHRRIEMTVARSNVTGHVLARLMGFKFESVMEGAHVTGDDMVMYKRMKY